MHISPGYHSSSPAWMMVIKKWKEKEIKKRVLVVAHHHHHPVRRLVSCLYFIYQMEKQSVTDRCSCHHHRVEKSVTPNLRDGHIRVLILFFFFQQCWKRCAFRCVDFFVFFLLLKWLIIIPPTRNKKQHFFELWYAPKWPKQLYSALATLHTLYLFLNSIEKAIQSCLIRLCLVISLAFEHVCPFKAVVMYQKKTGISGELNFIWY